MGKQVRCGSTNTTTGKRCRNPASRGTPGPVASAERWSPSWSPTPGRRDEENILSWSSFDALTGTGLRDRVYRLHLDRHSSYLPLPEAHESRLGKSAEA